MTFAIEFQLRELVLSCLRPDPLSRPDVNYVYDISKKMHEKFNDCSKDYYLTTVATE